MFRKIEGLSGEPETISLTVEGARVSAAPGETVAAVLLRAGYTHTRTTPVSDSPRAPYCLMGVCFDCLVEIDGIPNQKACQTPVREGMRVSRQDREGDLVG